MKKLCLIIFFFSISWIFAKPAFKPQVDGHRGYGVAAYGKGIEPENTLRAYRRLLEEGHPWGECDIRYTKDKKIILMHDDTVDRTTNGTGRVKDMTFEEIRKLDAGKGEKVPLLSEVLQLFKQYPKRRLFVEAKDYNLEMDAIKIITQLNMTDQVTVISFSYDILQNFRRLHPTIDIGILYGKPSSSFCAEAKKINASNIGVQWQYVTKALVEEVKKCDSKMWIWSWSPMTKKAIIDHCEWGVAVLSSENPAFTKEVIDEWWNSKP